MNLANRKDDLWYGQTRDFSRWQLTNKARNEGISIGEERGIERGKHEANLETARRLRAMGMIDNDIQKVTNLSFDEIRML